MPATNYFRLFGGKTLPSQIYPFDDGDRDDTQRAWELVSAHKKAAAVAWREPKLPGPWSGGFLVGYSRSDAPAPPTYHTPTEAQIAAMRATNGGAPPFVAGPEED